MNKSAPLGSAPLPGSNAPRGPFFLFLESPKPLAPFWNWYLPT